MATRRRSERSWVWKLGMLALIAIPGFALGLVARVAWDEPSLLGSHLLGGTTEVVAWSGDPIDTAPAAQAELPPVAAAAPATPRVPPPVPSVSEPAPPKPAARAATPVAPTPKPADATRTRPEAASPVAPAAAGRFAVQVGAFGEADSAERLAALLRGKGFDVYVSPGVAAGQARWRVRVGPSPSREAAERAASRLKAEEQLPTWVLDENGPL